ncbi:hypothetical protein DSL92_08920 [Billgrantia gudaonensis]|uniref:Uncharacterized protein n=1 Tax=Billgrantia gudaonensis TaxID=376427 RepID=A0A3S0NDF1_9GAMM|nr:hypothetical protein DSL92_08920 [Halomonas gudaonensis]
MPPENLGLAFKFGAFFPISPCSKTSLSVLKHADLGSAANGPGAAGTAILSHALRRPAARGAGALTLA